jgi:hypothetical protein
MTGHTDDGRSVKHSPASIEASSMTQAPSSGEVCLPLLSLIVWWLTGDMDAFLSRNGR